MNNGETDRRLLEAVEFDSLEEVGDVLKSGASLAAKDDIGESPLHLAVRRGDPRIVELLLDAGAEVNAKSQDGSTPLYLLCEWQSDESFPIATALIEAGADVDANRNQTNWGMLHHAAAGNKPHLTKLLLKAGANPNEQNNKNRWTPLHVTKSSEIARLLIEAEANPNLLDKQGKSPLLTAITLPTKANPSLQIRQLIRALIAAGAEVCLNDRAGLSALHAAVASDLTEVASLLIEQGADVTYSLPPFGTPLHRAVNRKNEAIVRQLIAAGAPLETPAARDGMTPLHFAAANGFSAAVQLLLDAGADATVKNARGEAPIQLAKCEKVKDVLKTYGAVLD
ncbi:MAG: ankyrin repeat domain-containing protein [Elainellaceae cyanobacterium]